MAASHRERNNPRESKRKDWKHNDRPNKAWNAAKTQRDREIMRMREEESEDNYEAMA
jgi:hypothetical protein